MKILFISDVYFPRVNGVSTSIRTFVAQLQAFGHTVDLIAPYYDVKSADEAWVQRITAHSIYFDPEDKLMKYSAVLKLLPELREVNYDLIHIHTPFVAHYAGIKLAKLLDIPCVETYHTFFEDYLHHYLPIIPKSLAKGLARLISKKQCNALGAMVAPSQPMLDVLRTYGITTQAEVIPTGLQAQSFAEADGAAFRAKYGIAQNRPMLLYVGRVAFEKNINFLLEMTKVLIAKQPNVLLVVAGEGPAEASLHKQTKELKLDSNIQFIGYLDRNTELNRCYQSADVFVFSSKSETQGLVLLEAMAQAKPVVSLAELGTKSILIEGEGALISTENTIEFADKVDYLLSHENARIALGAKAKAYVAKRWTDKAQAERLINFYKEMVTN